MEVDIALLQETELTRSIYTRNSSGYKIMATDALSLSVHQGGIALVWREDEVYEMEEVKFSGPHAISFQPRTGVDRYFVMGVYIPPSDLDTLAHVQKVWDRSRPKGCKLLLLGDLNIM